MPFPNEHAARLKDPADFADGSFRRVSGGTIYGSKEVPDGVDVIWGKLKSAAAPSDNPVPQALRFAAGKWTAAAARAWLKDNNATFILFEPASGEETRESIAEAIDAAKLKEESDQQVRSMILRLQQQWGSQDADTLAAALLAIIEEHARRGMPLRLARDNELNRAAKMLAQRTGRTDMMRFFEAADDKSPSVSPRGAPFVYIPAYSVLVQKPDGKNEIWVKDRRYLGRGGHENDPALAAWLTPELKNTTFVFEPRGANVSHTTLCDLMVAPKGWAPEAGDSEYEGDVQLIKDTPPFTVVKEDYAVLKDGVAYVLDRSDPLRDAKLISSLNATAICFVDELPPIELADFVVSLCLTRNVADVDIPEWGGGTSGGASRG